MKPILTYYGGKQTIIKHILELIPKHTCYVEPFFGGGTVFFAKEPSKVEVINDKLDYLVTFYRELQSGDFKKLYRRILYTLYSRAEYNKSKEVINNCQDYDSNTVAWAVFCNIYMSYGQIIGSGYGISSLRNYPQIYKAKTPLLLSAHNRLINTNIESDKALKIITRYDSEDTLFFLDPPYPNTDQGHYGGYTIDDYKQLF